MFKVQTILNSIVVLLLLSVGVAFGAADHSGISTNRVIGLIARSNDEKYSSDLRQAGDIFKNHDFCNPLEVKKARTLLYKASRSASVQNAARAYLCNAALLFLGEGGVEKNCEGAFNLLRCVVNTSSALPHDRLIAAVFLDEIMHVDRQLFDPASLRLNLEAVAALSSSFKDVVDEYMYRLARSFRYGAGGQALPCTHRSDMCLNFLSIRPMHVDLARDVEKLRGFSDLVGEQLFEKMHLGLKNSVDQRADSIVDTPYPPKLRLKMRMSTSAGPRTALSQD